MKKLMIAAVSAAAMLSSPAAFAQSFTTSVGTPVSYFGSGVLVQKGSGPLLSCQLGITIEQTSPGVCPPSAPMSQNSG